MWHSVNFATDSCGFLRDVAICRGLCLDLTPAPLPLDFPRLQDSLEVWTDFERANAIITRTAVALAAMKPERMIT